MGFRKHRKIGLQVFVQVRVDQHTLLAKRGKDAVGRDDIGNNKLPDGVQHGTTAIVHLSQLWNELRCLVARLRRREAVILADEEVNQPLNVVTYVLIEAENQLCNRS